MSLNNVFGNIFGALGGSLASSSGQTSALPTTTYDGLGNLFPSNNNTATWRPGQQFPTSFPNWVDEVRQWRSYKPICTRCEEPALAGCFHCGQNLCYEHMILHYVDGHHKPKQAQEDARMEAKE